MYSHLLSPVQIGDLELRNRIAMAPMGVELGDEEGAVTEGVIAYYEARARGGAGLLITDRATVSRANRSLTARAPGAIGRPRPKRPLPRTPGRGDRHRSHLPRPGIRYLRS